MIASELATQLHAKRTGTGWIARCPAHEDRRPSLSITAGDDDRVLLKCHAGCTFSELLNAMGLKAGDLYPDNGTARINRSRPEARAARPIPNQKHDAAWWGGQWIINTELVAGNGVWRLAAGLGIDRLAVIDIGFRETAREGVYVVPLFNRLGMCGIHYRGLDGSKWLKRGSQCALFIPRSYREGPLLICEGATDAAAMLSIGLDAIGRFNATQNPQFIIDWLKPQGRRDVVLVVDDDQAGEEGAHRVADALRFHTKSVRMVTPGRFEDAREWVKHVPGRIIRDAINASVRL